jgi:hypothetical protein
MKTDRSSRMVTNLVLALAGAFIFTGVASGQAPVYAGKFTLPFEARWGSATLPAGDYSFKLDTVDPAGALVLFRGTRAVALIRNQMHSMEPSDYSRLTVVQNSAGNTVRELSLPEIGVVLHYPLSKPGRASAAAEREIAQRIPVTTSGK